MENDSQDEIDRLGHVTLKFERAKHHAANLEREVGEFLASQPYRVAYKHDPNTKKLVYYVSDVAPTPNTLPLLAGDAIQNLVSTLDHLAYQLVCRDTGDNPPSPRQIYFPVADSEENYQSQKGRKLQGASPQTIDAIDALAPYKGGNDAIWILSRLNNIEKHRVLLTVGSVAAGFNVAQYGARSAAKSGMPPEFTEAIRGLGVFIKEVGAASFPLTAGYELFIGDVDEEPDPEQQFKFDVAVSEPGIVSGESLVKVVRQGLHEVGRIVDSLGPELT